MRSIKVDSTVVPEIIARDVQDTINESGEFKSIEELKEFLVKMREN